MGGCGVYFINRDCQCARWCIAFIGINEIGFGYHVEILREVREPCNVLAAHVWDNKMLHEIVGHDDRTSVRYNVFRDWEFFTPIFNLVSRLRVLRLRASLFHRWEGASVSVGGWCSTFDEAGVGVKWKMLENV